MSHSRQYPARPIVGVGAIVWQGDKVLLARRAKPPRAGSWSLPGGLQKIGETVFEAARREVREETAIAIHVLGMVDVVDSIRRDAHGRVQYHYTLVDVHAEWQAGEPKGGTDASDAAWFALEDIPALGMWAETVKIIERSRQMRAEASSIVATAPARVIA